MEAEFENFKEQVRSAADIVEVISGYVGLKKKGQNFWGCCPFHGEKTPSFAVNPSKNMFYCFGCHEGGDVFRFIMKSENIGFMDALKLLAGRYGIPVPERQKTAAEMAREQKNKEIYAANELAGRFYQACLLRTPHGAPALEYLAGRGIGPDIINSFSIGLALNHANSLLQSLGKRGITPQQLQEAGLVQQNARGLYDKFRHRIMIPIKDPKGRIVGFGGRVLGEGEPKYLNTAETPWFNKRRLLFGFDIALKAIRSRRQALVVEGYMDAISLQARGIDYVVASMGTAFAAEQAQLLKRVADEIVFCYDSDAAGRRASVRAVSVAAAAGLQVRVAQVPQGKDPDEFVRQHGREAFEEVVAAAKNGIDFQIDETILQLNVTNLAGKVNAVSNTIPFLLECKNQIEVADHIAKLAQKLTIDEGLIAEEYRKAARKQEGRPMPEPQPAAAPVKKEQSSAAKEAARLLLAALIEQPALIPHCQQVVEEIGLENAAHREIFSLLVQQGVGLDTGWLNSRLQPDYIPELAAILAQSSQGQAEQIMHDCLRQLKRLQLEQEYARHRRLAVEYEHAGDERMLTELMESQRIKNEIKKLYGQ